MAMGALRTNWLEAVAVTTGLAYVLLILRRNRWGWVAGAVSSTIYVLIAARARLPMQSVLNGYYVVMAVYGWISWTRNAEEQGGRIFSWPLRRHLLAAMLILAVSALSARFLAALNQDDWPLLDSVATWTSFLATWLVARSVLENWCYWIAADLISVFMYLQQGHAATAGLFASYIVVACLGLYSWLRRYRQQQP
jgi:nicotinamide mononucleotide transporter